ncbi:hypothetical protein ACMZ0U_001869, partial [Campylobacter jejuni]
NIKINVFLILIFFCRFSLQFLIIKIKLNEISIKKYFFKRFKKIKKLSCTFHEQKFKEKITAKLYLF